MGRKAKPKIINQKRGPRWGGSQPLSLFYTTLPSQKEGRRLARLLVEGGLVACANLKGPIESTYSWKERVEVSVEWALLLKAPQSQRGKIEDFLDRNHPYEIPCFIEIPVRYASKAYKNWIDFELRLSQHPLESKEGQRKKREDVQ